MADIIQLQHKLNYQFTNLSLLQQALTHRSYGKINYERLEFVGDSILDYVIAVNLYHKHAHLPEGELSKIRAALVNENSLAEVAASLELGSYLLLEHGEEKSGGRLRASILADSLEAVFAAISLDSDFYQAKKVIDMLFDKKCTNIEFLVTQDSKSLLQEYLQEQQLPLPVYKTIRVSGPDHDSVFTIECTVAELQLKITAEGKTKKEASQIAATKILPLVREKIESA